jgi:predicted O-methyltransferase YrrM
VHRGGPTLPVVSFDPAWALGPEGLRLVEALVAEGRNQVVECGSGLSTVTIARALRARGRGHVHALEHSPDWAATTREALGNDAFATVVDASLVDGWYDRCALDRLPAGGVDLLLVDGPPAGRAGLEESRYPALPALAGRLGPGAAIVLDDADRAGERRVLERWRAEFPLELGSAPAGVALAMYLPGRFQGRQETISERKHERNS